MIYPTTTESTSDKESISSLLAFLIYYRVALHACSGIDVLGGLWKPCGSSNVVQLGRYIHKVYDGDTRTKVVHNHKYLHFVLE